MILVQFVQRVPLFFEFCESSQVGRLRKESHAVELVFAGLPNYKSGTILRGQALTDRAFTLLRLGWWLRPQASRVIAEAIHGSKHSSAKRMQRMGEGVLK